MGEPSPAIPPPLGGLRHNITHHRVRGARPRSDTNVFIDEDKARANVAKNCLIVTLTSLELGYGSILERYQQERNMAPPVLSSVILTDEELFTRVNDPIENDSQSAAAPAAMPPPTRVSGPKPEPSANSVGTVGVKDANLKMYHVMSVKQTLREDLAEHAYQFSCRAADWSRSDLRFVPMQFEPLEEHVVDALGQQEVPDYFQQPAKAITEDVSVMRGPHALEWSSLSERRLNPLRD